MRTIVDRLQQENAELRRSEAFNSPHQSLPTAGQGSYTLHPPYASTSIDRSLETYGGNALAFAEMLQPGAYPASLVNPSQHSESEQSYPAYPLQSPSHPHRLAQLSSPRSSGIYHSQQQVDWSAVRQVSGGDRPEAAAVDGVPSRPLQHHDHERSEPPQSYLHQSTNQGNAYYQPSGRPPAVRADGSAHNIHHQNSHSTSPSSAEPSHAGAIGNPYSGYSSAHNAGNNHPQGAVRPPLGAADSTSSWHSAGTPHMNFHHLAPSRDENQDYQYPHRQHPPQMQAAFQDHSRSVTQSPVAGVR